MQLQTAGQLINLTKTEERWEWARDDQNRGELKLNVKATREKLSRFILRMMTENPLIVRKQYDEHFIPVGLYGLANVKNVIALLKECIKDIQTCRDAIFISRRSTPKKKDGSIESESARNARS